MNEYVRKATEAARKLRTIQAALSKLETTGVVETATPAHAAFETYVSLSALVDIGARYDLRLSDGSKVLRIPKAPAEKSNFPHFVAHREGNPVFQVCLGTRYSASNTETGPHETYAPDLSVQVADSPQNPTGKHVILAWDAKYTASRNLDEGEVLKVASKMNDKCPVGGPIHEDVFREERHPNCDAVLTNKGHSGLTDTALRRMDLVEVAGYGSGTETTRGGFGSVRRTNPLGMVREIWNKAGTEVLIIVDVEEPP